MKKIILIILATMVVSFSASAQIFILESDDDLRNPAVPGMGFTNPDIHNSGEDWAYVPAGSGALLLAGLAGAYLLGKKKEK